MIKDISFEITQKCLNNCLHCSSCSNASCQQQIDFNTICKTVDDMPLMGVKRVCLSGGEPFLHQDLERIVSYISKLGIEVNIYTSGITEINGIMTELSVKQLEYLKSIGLSKLMFNVQSADEILYDIITGTKGRFPILLRSIHNAIHAGVYTEIHFVPMKLNVGGINDIIAFAKSVGIDKVSFLKLVPHGRAKQNQEMIQLSPSETVGLREELNNINSGNVRIGIPLSLNFESDYCHAASTKLYIKFDGNVYGCEAFKYIQQLDSYNNKIQPCNIFNESLLDIYNKSDYICATRKFIKKYSTVDSTCESCPVQKYLEKIGGNSNDLHN